MEDNIITAYLYWRRRHRTPADALSRAKADVAAKASRWVSRGKPCGAVSWQRESGIAWVDNPKRIGLRHVGDVEADARYSDPWNKRGKKCGWYADNHQSSTYYGVVYQLPARDGQARFVAGYAGTDDEGVTIDFFDVYDECRRGCSSWDSRDISAARSAATTADYMAKNAAEEAREYDAAWSAGRRYAECRERLKEIRESILETVRDMKSECENITRLPKSVRTRIRESIESMMEERRQIHEEMETLKDGDMDLCSFWPGNKKLRAAFNEGAEEKVLK